MLSKKKTLICPKNSSEDKCRAESCQSIIVEYPAWFGCASYKDHFVQRQFQTRETISKAQESLRTRIFCTRWYLNFYIHTSRSHFVQRPFLYKGDRTKTQESIQCVCVFEFLDCAGFFFKFQHQALIR